MSISDYLGIAGILIGAILSYYFYRKSIRIKEPVWSIRSYNLVQGLSSKLSGVDVTYNGESVHNLTITKLMFWNAGEETLNAADIKTSDPLRITISDAIVLEASILQSNNPSTQFQIEVSKSGDAIFINFDYLNHLDGAVIQIIHTGISSAHLSVQGAIKGVKAISKYMNKRMNRTSKVRFFNKTFLLKRSTILLTTAVIVFLCAVIEFLPTKSFNPLRPVEFKDWLFLVFGGLFLIDAFYYFLKALNLLGSKFPENLDKYAEE